MITAATFDLVQRERGLPERASGPGVLKKEPYIRSGTGPAQLTYDSARGRVPSLTGIVT